MKELAIFAGAAAGAAAGIWLWWALPLSWWIGFPLALFFALVARMWVGWQVGPLVSDSDRNLAVYDALSWISIGLAIAVPLACFMLTPQSRTRSERSASAALMLYYVYPQAAAILLGLIGLMGVRNWRPVGLLVRCIIGVIIGCLGAFLILMGVMAKGFTLS